VKPKTTTCRLCGTSIFFAPTSAKRLMPLDAEPREDGNVTLDRYGVAEVHPVGMAPGAVRYRSHFASCAQAASHRKTKGGA
jgi:hypothetical protein